LLIATDHRCNCFTNHRRTSWRGKKLQLGWQVYLVFLLASFDPDFFPPQLVPPCGQRPLPFVREVVRPYWEKTCSLLRHFIILGKCLDNNSITFHSSTCSPGNQNSWVLHFVVPHKA
jgi:hypothetical protein